MSLEVKAPKPDKHDPMYPRIFLAGAIDMDKAERWQDKIVATMPKYINHNVVFINPRRDEWDASWEQDPTIGTQFEKQVTWELNGLSNADIKLFYFTPDSKAPITFMELGRYADKKSVVMCPDGFYRKGNIVIFCRRHNITLVESFEALMHELGNRVESFYKNKGYMR